MKKAFFEGVQKYWTLITATVAVIVFAISLAGRVTSLEQSVTLLRTQVEKTCDKMDTMARDVTEIRVNMATMRPQAPAPATGTAGQSNTMVMMGRPNH